MCFVQFYYTVCAWEISGDWKRTDLSSHNTETCAQQGNTRLDRSVSVRPHGPQPCFDQSLYIRWRHHYTGHCRDQSRLLTTCSPATSLFHVGNRLTRREYRCSELAGGIVFVSFTTAWYGTSGQGYQRKGPGYVRETRDTFLTGQGSSGYQEYWTFSLPLSFTCMSDMKRTRFILLLSPKRAPK